MEVERRKALLCGLILIGTQWITHLLHKLGADLVGGLQRHKGRWEVTVQLLSKNGDFQKPWRGTRSVKPNYREALAIAGRT